MDVNHTTGACCILWQQQLLINSVLLGAVSITGYLTLTGENRGS